MLNMSTTEIGNLIFDSGKTLFEILDSLDVPQVSSQLEATNLRLDDVNDQLRQLGQIVDSNQANNNASFINVNTQLDALSNEVTALTIAVAPITAQIDILTTQVNQLSAQVDPISAEVADLSTQVFQLSNEVATLTVTVQSFNSRITQTETQVTALQNRVTTLELTRATSMRLYLGNEYVFSYRTGGIPGTTFFYRITFSGSTSTEILAARGYPASVLDSQNGSSTSRTVYLAAPFDLFSTNGRFNYPIVQGPCVLSFSVNNTSPLSGYITSV